MRAALLLGIATAARVTQDQWKESAQEALDAARPLYVQAADSGCVVSISTKHVTATSTSALRLCRVDHGGAVDPEKTAVLAMVDSTWYLELRGNWEAFLNKAAYCRHSKRAFYLWLGVPPPEVLNKRTEAPWAHCKDRRAGNTLNGVKTLAFLALFDGENSPASVLYVDADAWFSDVAFTRDDVTPEAYLALADAEILGNQNRIGGPKIPMNGGLVFARRSQFTREFFALWWWGRCGKKDQLPLWATLFASWSAASDGAYDFDGALFDRYALAHNKRGALHVLQRDFSQIRAKAGLAGPFDGGAFKMSGRLHETALALPHLLLLPSAPVGSLPALRSDIDEKRPTFVCHTRIDAVEHGGQCRGADVCARGKCAPFV